VPPQTKLDAVQEERGVQQQQVPQRAVRWRVQPGRQPLPGELQLLRRDDLPERTVQEEQQGEMREVELPRLL
jgi:hypothetical protein